MRRSSFIPLLITNVCGVANDNFLKTLASFVLLGWVADERTRSVLVGITAASLVLPYILFSPLADRLTVLFSKCRIVRLAKVAELPIIALAILGFVFHSTGLVVASIVLMGLQSSLFSPAKYALIRDIGGVDRISSGMGLMEGVSFLGVLGGTVIASFVADLTPVREFARLGSLCVSGKGVGYLILAALAVAGLLFSFTLHAREERNREIHAVGPVRFFRRARRMAKRYPGLADIIATLCVFWGTAAMLQQGMLVYGTQVLRLDATHTGLLLVLAAVGIVSGQVLAGFLDRRFALLSHVPLFGLIASLLLAILFFAPLTPTAFGCVLAALAFDLGFFKLPLDAAIQRTVKGPRLNTILAYFNQITFLYMFGASVVYAALGWLLGLRAFLVFLAALMAVAAFRFTFGNRDPMFRFGVFLFSPRYRIVTDPLPEGRPLLVLPNHPALIDPLLVLTAYRKTKLRPLVDATFFAVPFFARVLRTLGAVEVPDLRTRHTRTDVSKAKGLKDVVLDTLRAGENVIFYPSGHIYTENREEIGTRQLAYTVCRELPPNVTVVSLHTEGLWGSSWSRKGRTSSPSFVLTLLRGALLWPLSFVRPRRTVTMRVADVTDRVREWSNLTRLEFNARLSDFTNNLTTQRNE